jgi:hypothetical protein
MIDGSKILAGLPVGLRDSLIESYKEIGRNFLEHRWEPSELNGGKFCEAAYTIIAGSLSGKFPARPSKPRDMVKDCRALEMIPADTNRVGDRSLRILIPRVLPILYEVRNNRGVGHIGGEVDPNYMDAMAVYSMASWMLAELVRVFHSVSPKDAQTAVDNLVERKHPLVWEVGGIKRVLDPSMAKSDQALLLLYSEPAWVQDRDLMEWVEYSGLSMFRKRVLEPLHASRLVEHNPSNDRVRISPKGVVDVEQRLLKTRV